MPLPRLQIATAPEFWATDPGAVLEPSTAEKEAGFAVNTKGPARIMNFIANRALEQARQALISPLFDWRDVDCAFAAAITAVGFHPVDRNFYGVTGNNIRTSYDGGKTWSSGLALPAGSYGRQIAIGNDYVAIPIITGTLLYYRNVSTGGAWTDAGGAAQVNGYGAAAMNYGVGNRIIIAGMGGAATYVFRYASDPSSTWTDATLPSAWTSGSFDRCNGIIHLAAQTWFAIGTRSSDDECIFIRSTDDGVTWQIVGATGLISADVTGFVTSGSRGALACNPDTGTIAVVGSISTTSNKSIVYTVDQGDSWDEADVEDTTEEGSSEVMTSIQYCGFNTWVAAGAPTEYDAPTQKTPGLWISTDDARTWRQVNSLFTANVDTINSLAVGNRKVIAALDTGDVFASNSVAQL